MTNIIIGVALLVWANLFNMKATKEGEYFKDMPIWTVTLFAVGFAFILVAIIKSLT